MNTVWERDYTLRLGDFDRFGRLQPSAVLGLFQDAAGRHAEELGLGFDAMLKRQYLWVLVRVKFRVMAPAARYQTVRVRTWPLAPNRFNFGREYGIFDTDGNPLVIGSSEWVIVHSEERRLTAVPDLYPFRDGFCEDRMFEGKLAKIRPFAAEGTPYIVNAGFSELDMNGHVNNTKYANFVLDAVDPTQDDVVDTFQIDYRKEVMQGTELHVSFTREGKEILAQGQSAEGETMFTCRIDLA